MRKVSDEVGVDPLFPLFRGSSLTGTGMLCSEHNYVKGLVDVALDAAL
jgi:hypothetical protein